MVGDGRTGYSELLVCEWAKFRRKVPRVVIRVDVIPANRRERDASQVNFQNRPAPTVCLPVPTVSSIWLPSNSWGPSDDLELGLDPATDLCDEAFAQDSIDISSPPLPRRRRKKTKVSVREFPCIIVITLINQYRGGRMLFGGRIFATAISRRSYDGRGGETYERRWFVLTAPRRERAQCQVKPNIGV